jgi:gliding motility-associated-like protein
MNNNFDKNIQELLQSHTENPPADCWNKIETQLETLQTPNANSNSSPASSGSSSPFSQFVGTITGKIVSTVAAVATIGGVISLIVINSTENETAKQSGTITIQEEIQNNLPSNEDYVRIIEETDTLHIISRNENAVEKTICTNEHIDTMLYHEQESISLAHTPYIPPVNLIPQPQTGNTTKQEMTPKTENNSKGITTEPEKEKISNNKNSNLSQDIEKEDTQAHLEHPEVIIPNIFTPNGDYINDYFVIEDLDRFSETHLIIFRRDGKVIYEKINYQNDWQAENIQDDVYFYVFKFIYQGSQFMRNGSITVKR